MDGKVKVVMNGRMEPLGVEVKDGALGDARVNIVYMYSTIYVCVYAWLGFGVVGLGWFL